MNYNQISEEGFKQVTKSITTRSTKGNIWIVGLCLVILWGFYGLYKQITVGHVVTGMRDNVVWGLFIVNFIFLIGIGYSGAIIAGLLRLFRPEWPFPVMRIVALPCHAHLYYYGGDSRYHRPCVHPVMHRSSG
jgi:molybdopterin-containing oxidoreductase family membrane subunit